MNNEPKTVNISPVVRLAEWALRLLQNQVVIDLIMLATGVMFLVAPAGNMKGTVIAVAAIVVAAALVNIIVHLFSQDRTNLDCLLASVNGVLLALASACLIDPAAIEPFVRYVVAIFTIVTNLITIRWLLRLPNKKTGRFIVGMLVAVPMIGLGIAMMVAGEAVIIWMQRCIGAFMIANACISLWYALIGDR